MAIKFEFDDEQDAEFLIRCLEDNSGFWTKQIKSEIAAGRKETNLVHVSNMVLLRTNYLKDRLWEMFRKQTEEIDGGKTIQDGHVV
jgi:hypothetical protein